MACTIEDAISVMLADLRIKDTPGEQIQGIKKTLLEIDPRPDLRNQALDRIMHQRTLSPDQAHRLHSTLRKFAQRTSEHGMRPDKLFNALINLYDTELLIRRGREIEPFFRDPVLSYDDLFGMQISEGMKAAHYLERNAWHECRDRTQMLLQPQFTRDDAKRWWAERQYHNAYQQNMIEKEVGYGTHLIETRGAREIPVRTPTLLHTARAFKKASEAFLFPERQALLESAVAHYEEGLARHGKNGEEVFSRWFVDAGEAYAMLAACVDDPARKQELQSKAERYAAIGNGRRIAYQCATASQARPPENGSVTRLAERFAPQSFQSSPQDRDQRRRFYSKDK